MRILSVQVGKIREIAGGGRRVRTGIFKEGVLGPVWARRLGLDGDTQADLRVHGGPDKAVYAYDRSSYDHWRRDLSVDFPHGQFGENLTVEGLADTEVRIGDVYRVGEALLQVTSPRSPCYKLALRMERPSFPRTFLASGRTGFYLRVLEDGNLEAGDEITLVSRESGMPSVQERVREIYGPRRVRAS